MATFNSPLSGAVSQAFGWWLDEPLLQNGFININAMVSSDTELERKIITEVAGYGQQLGRIVEALTVVIRRLNKEQEREGDAEAIRAFVKMAQAIQDQKRIDGVTAEEMLNRAIEEVEAKPESESGQRMIRKMQALLSKLESQTHRVPTSTGGKGLLTTDKRTTAPTTAW